MKGSAAWPQVAKPGCSFNHQTQKDMSAAFVNPNFTGRRKLMRNLAYDLAILGKELTPELIEAINDLDLHPDQKEGNPIRAAYEFGMQRRKQVHALFTTPAHMAAHTAAMPAHASSSAETLTPDGDSTHEGQQP